MYAALYHHVFDNKSKINLCYGLHQRYIPYCSSVSLFFGISIKQ